MQAKSHKRNFPIVQIKTYGPVDKLMMLWTICTIDHYTKTNNRKILAPYYMNIEFGKRITSMFDLMVDCLIPYKVIDINSMTLTPRGQYVADNWQEIFEQLLPES